MLDEEGKLKGLNTGTYQQSFLCRQGFIFVVRVEWTKDSGGRWKMEEVPDSEKFFPAQLVFLALCFLGPQNEVLKAMGIKQDARSNIQTLPKVNRMDLQQSSCKQLNELFFQKFSTNVEGVFAAGDCRRGQSLIVWGIK